jgi:hemerythrin-like domain-containing protein
MNPITMIKQDHDRVRKLFRDFDGADGGRRQQIADQVMLELDVHASIEEEIFYPALRSQGTSEDKELVAEAYDEHASAKQLIQQLRGMSVDDPQFTPLFRQLRQDIEHHADEEEQEMLPRAEEELRDRLDRLGQEMTARKEQLMGQMQGQRR